MKVAYYNDNDPFACAWLRELIADGLIAPGDVDERSITDVEAADLKRYTQVHLFAGIGGWSYALRLAGWPDDRPAWTGSCPCQPFSTAGKRQGATDARHLWPEMLRLVSKCRPATVFGEQVASRLGREWLAGVRADLEHLGYAVGAADLPAAGVGAPHIRQRLWWVADSDGREPRDRGLQPGEKHRQQPQDDGAVEWMGHTDERVGEQVRSLGAGCDHRSGAVEGAGPCGNGFAGPWPDSRLIQCADGKSRRIPLEPKFFLVVDGLSSSVVDLCVAYQQEIEKTVMGYAKTTQTRPREALFDLWHTATTAAAGGHASLSSTAVLLAVLCQFAEQRWPVAESISCARKEASKGPLRSVWLHEAAACSPHRRKLDEQQSTESTNTLRELSQILARDSRSTQYETVATYALDAFPLSRGLPNRVGMLRGAGNSIVPQLATKFIEAYVKCKN